MRASRRKQKRILSLELGGILVFLIFISFSVFFPPERKQTNEFDVNQLLEDRPTKTVDVANLLKEYPQVNECLKSNNGHRVVCVDEYLGMLTEKEGVRAALDVIESLVQKHTDLLAVVHPFAHTIGSHSLTYFDKYNMDLESKIGLGLVSCDGFGSFGCYHGVIEVGLGQIPIKERATIVRKACIEDPLIASKPYFVQQCAHWFGHGVTIFSDMTLMQALEMCEGLNPNWGHGSVQLCLSGVFHSGLAPGESDEAELHNISNVFKEGDPYYPCLEIPERFRGHCYSHAYGRARNADIGVQLSTCDNIPEQDPVKKRIYVGGCYDSVGNNVVETAHFNPQKVREICQTYSKEEYRPFCYGGAARYWVLRNPLLENKGPIELCKEAEESAKPFCYSRAGFGNFENFASYEILKEFCGNSEGPYERFCLARSAPRDFLGGYVELNDALLKKQ